MSQHDYNIANQGFPAFRSDLNNALSAIQTTNSGTSRPSGAVAGQLWLDTTSATTPTLKYFDGTDDISLATIDHTANTVNWLDSTVSITGLSTTATGTVLTLSDTATTSTVNLIIDNQKEIRFRETTANGTNYVALKAPASVSADLTFTLPSADGTNGQALVTNGSGVLSFTTISAGTSWQSVQTTGFTAVSGRGYPCNTTSSAFTVTLPASPSVGDYIQIVDYAGTFATNNITLGANSNKIEGVVANKTLTTNREAVTITYVDSTQGWVSTSGSNEGSKSIDPSAYSADYLIIAGGGGGGYSDGGGGGAGGYLSGTTSFGVGTVYTVTVGAGGSGNTGVTPASINDGNSSSITGLTTAIGGGGGGSLGATPDSNGRSGGSGGGGGNAGTGGSGTSGQGNSGGSAPNISPLFPAAGGGGAGAVGNPNASSSTAGAGGAGTASSITGSSVTYAGGGGGGTQSGGTAGAGGSGGGGAGFAGNSTATAGSVNTGGGGGGSAVTGGAGGSGVVILRMLTTNYSGTTTGSPTVTTDGSYKVVKFTASGSYTG